ncbi:AraC family transcriptional regulator [Alteromonas sediminis]|uniref:AraC family transcriptional regulator n=1 Tax=Alteromonas sediminis TaxID=2259342 RepID=A0A3N5YQV4_9ALTE|nr:AraC family transcriptional regulator [Alteromonas sediminis]RPJ68661.1 AraC family transcriptional regulator [Alteromonas sediminis]
MPTNQPPKTNKPVSESLYGQLLSQMSLDSLFFIRSRLQSPWSIDYPPIKNCMIFHRVMEGEASVETSNEHYVLKRGDFTLLPLGKGHILSDGSGTEPVPLFDLPINIAPGRYENLHFGGNGGKCSLICGAVTFTHPLTKRLIKSLPSSITVHSTSSQVSHTIKTISELIADEVTNLNPGTTGATSKLADLLVITAIRDHLDKASTDTPTWLGALKDPRITKAIELVHESPSRHWSIAELAQAVGMSRTGFAVQFKQLVGNSPIDYLTEWRMSLAYSAIKQTNKSIIAIALDFGYQSESSFTRAFKKVIGRTPGEIRRIKALT